MDRCGCTVMNTPVMKMKAVILVKLCSEEDTGSEEGRRGDLDETSLLKNITVLVRNNNTFETIYEWWGYDAGCFQSVCVFFCNKHDNV